MERAAVRDWAAQRAMVVLGALLTMASAAAEYVNAAMEVEAHRVHQLPERDPHPHRDDPLSLLKRFAMTEEVANLVTYVCSPLSAATNGAALRVDGGVVQACF